MLSIAYFAPAFSAPTARAEREPPKAARSVAEEAPGAYKDVSEVVKVTEHAQLARKVAKLAPLICIKG